MQLYNLEGRRLYFIKTERHAFQHGYRPRPVRGTVLLLRATGHLPPDLRDPALTADRFDLAGR